MNLWNETKSIPISRAMVWAAYKKVRANQGGPGVDTIDMDEFDADRSKHLYKLWNRMSSGSYFPPPVKETEILKQDGKVRKLGVPTISDRVGQMVIKDLIESRLEKIFSNNSYAYRPNKDAHQALTFVRINCRKTDWVIDLDIKGFFDNIDHNKMMRAIEKHVTEKWILLYIKRWLTAPVLTKSGDLVERQGKGTPQGGVISPLLANLFLHYALDMWLEQTDKTVKYARYADDVIIHCVSKTHAEQMLKRIEERMAACNLELHPDKTKLVYCRDYRRTGTHPQVKFDFLGYSFQPRPSKSKQTGKMFLGYDCAVSIRSRKQMADKLEELKIESMSYKSIVGIAQQLNPIIRGWIQYYGLFKSYELSKVFRLLRSRLIRWVRKRYKRYKTSLRRAFKWLDNVRKQYPNLFYHWQLGFSN